MPLLSKEKTTQELLDLVTFSLQGALANDQAAGKTLV
jgi:hypothetical protein